MSLDLRRLIPADLRADPRGRAGYWLFAGHVLTFWGLAISNAFLGLSLLWSFRRRPTWDWTNVVLALKAALWRSTALFRNTTHYSRSTVIFMNLLK